MTNVTDIFCPHCNHNKCDTLAILGRSTQIKDPNDDTKMIDKMKKTVLYRCLRCHNQFEQSPKINMNYTKFFKLEAVKDAMKDA